MTEDELIAIINNATPPVVYPELWPQPVFAASTGLTLGATWSVSGGEAINSGTFSNLDGLLEEAIVPGAIYRLVVTYTGFGDGLSAFLVGVSTQGLGPVASGSPTTVDFPASASANTSLRFANLDDGAGALQAVSLKRTA